MRSTTAKRLNPFVPSQLSGLKAWFEGDNGLTHSGANVTGWTDLSGIGNSLNVVSATAPTYAAAGLNGKPTAQFVKASSTHLSRLATDIIATGAYTVGIVLRVDASTDGQKFFGNVDTNVGGWVLQQTVSSYDASHYAQGANAVTAAITLSAWKIVTVHRSGSGVVPTVRVNSVTQSLSTSTSAILDGGAADALSMGAWLASGAGPTSFSDCTIASALMCNADNDPSSLETYWNSKYGVF